MSLSIPDIAYSPFKGNKVVSLWRELALNREIEVEAFTTERACKIKGKYRLHCNHGEDD